MRKILLIVAIVIVAVIVFKDDILKIFKTSSGVSIKIVHASSYIPSGTIITNSMLESRDVPKAYIQPAAISSLDEAVGKISLAPIAEGEQILANKLSKTGTSLANSLPIGKRAVSIQVDSVSGVAGLLKPGNTVDILSTIDVVEVQKVVSYTVTLLQNIKVVAVGNKFEPVDSKEKEEEENLGTSNVTLALTPEEAELVTFAEQKGRLKLSLRTPMDESTITPKNVSFSSVIKSAKQPQTKKETPVSPEIIRGIEENK